MNLFRGDPRLHASSDNPSLVDGDLGAFVVSLLVHLGLLIGLGLIPLLIPEQMQVTIKPPQTLDLADEPQIDEEFHFDDQPTEDIGATNMAKFEMTLSMAPEVSETPDIPNPLQQPLSDIGAIKINEAIEVATGSQFDENLAVKGAAGEGVKGAVGAVDRITHEILLSLEERKTLVVWLFDQSGSLNRQRASITERLSKIYEELGVIEAQGIEAFSRHDEKPLLSSVISFGGDVNVLTKKPTDEVSEITSLVSSIEQDDSGLERVFSAVWTAADRYKRMRVPTGSRKEPERNVLLIVFTDESGDDTQGLDDTVKICRRYGMPVYVVGVPAPFGRQETLVKWVDPDPKFDQSPQWAPVSQGPESLFPERIKLDLEGIAGGGGTPIDSGFGPYALTRLCYETGGIYFTVHPNRRVNRAVGRGEVAPFSAHLSRFFDPQRMHRYRPDYVSVAEYNRRLNENKARAALVQAARHSWIAPMESPRLRFVKRSEPQLVGELTEAQKDAAKLGPRLSDLYQVLKLGEADREKEAAPRWQAGYDLALGRVLAVQVRTVGYNAMLAKLKRGIEFKNKKSNTWVLRPSKNITVDSKLARLGEKANELLTQVVHDHPGTPWAHLAQQELNQPLGWEWKEEHTETPAERARRRAANNNNNRPRPARDDQRRMLRKPLPKRSPPKL